MADKWFEAVPVIDGKQRAPTYFYAENIAESAIERYAEVHRVQKWASIRGRVPPQGWFDAQLEMLGKARAISADQGAREELLQGLDLDMFNLQALALAARKYHEARA